CQKWQGRLPGCLAEDSQRNSEQLSGVVEARDVSSTAGGEISLVQGVGHQDANAQSQGDRKTNPLAEGRIMYVARRTKMETGAAGTHGIKKKMTDEQSSHHAECQ